jgi:hypothetical protein
MLPIGHVDVRFTRACAGLALAAVVLAVAARPAGAAGGGLAYDELTRMVISTQGSGPPEAGSYANGSFAADFQAAVNSAQPPKHHNGMFSSITNAIEMGQQAMNEIKTGMPATHYYLNGWERTDDPALQTATIYRGDLRQTIHLDLAKKTYYIETADEKVFEGTPPPMVSARPGPQPSPQPGTAKMAFSASSAALGPRTLDGQPTNGYKMTFKMTVSDATGSCKNGSFATSMTEFISQFPEPTVSTPSGKVVSKKSSYDPQRMAVTPGCKPTVTANTKMGATPPSGMLPLWMYMAMNGSMAAQQQQPPNAPQGSGFGFLIERGNVRTLGASDASLFQVPAGFTQVSASPTP